MADKAKAKQFSCPPGTFEKERFIGDNEALFFLIQPYLVCSKTTSIPRANSSGQTALDKQQDKTYICHSRTIPCGLVLGAG
ncbi:hypothetical protein GCM10008943_04800 [Paenochrobactrum glaciei]|uniref:Uncharacterized protein n=1 Tax=Paenochrobactrum glaciei TaxID=486407 RepID=A0ABN1FKL8_9HYPH